MPASTAQALAYRAAIRPLVAGLAEVVSDLLDDLEPALAVREDEITASRLRALLDRLRSALQRRFSIRAGLLCGFTLRNFAWPRLRGYCRE